MMLTVMLASAIIAAPGSPDGGLSLSWWTVDAGGGSSKGGVFALSGTVGQPDAGAMQGGSFTLSGGFWNSARSGISGRSGYVHYLPVVRR